MNKQQRAGFAFIHGAGLNNSIWCKVVEAEDWQHPYLLLDYPDRRKDAPPKDLSLNDYVTFMKKQLDTWPTQKFIIVAHSLGGVITLKLASELADRVIGFVAIGAAIPKEGDSFLSVLPFPKRILISAIMKIMGTKPPESAIRSGLCHDLSAEDTAAVVRDFIPESIRVYADCCGAPTPDVPKLYVKLTEDQEFTPALQNKMIANLSPQSVHNLSTGHLPMLGDPAGLRSALETFLASIERSH